MLHKRQLTAAYVRTTFAILQDIHDFTPLALLINADVVDFQLADQSLARQDRSPIAFPLIVDHHVKDQLHRTTFNCCCVAVELTTFHAIDVPGNVA